MQVLVLFAHLICIAALIALGYVGLRMIGSMFGSSAEQKRLDSVRRRDEVRQAAKQRL